MSLLAPWLLFPATLAVLTLGCGLLLERVAGAQLRGALIAPVGFAAIVVAAEFTTHTEATAPFTTPVIVALATAGLVCGIRRLPRRGLLAPAIGGLVVFAVFGAPVVLSGEATFAGYIELDDTATFLALTDRVLEHGSGVSGLAPSSYEATLAVNLGHAYPVGSLLPFGIGRGLVGVDGAWLYQPYLAFAAALLALVLYDLTRWVIRPRAVRAGASVIAAQPALLYGYALWGGIKELVAAPLLALVAALAPTLLDTRTAMRSLLPLATALAAVVGVLSLGGVVWFVAPALVLGVMAVRGRGIARRGALVTAGFLVLALPSLLDASSFFDSATSTAVRSGIELGNLVRPLNPLQVFGVWPSGDFRFEPTDPGTTWILLGVTVASAMLGVAAAWRRRAMGTLLFVAAAAAACTVMALVGSPWVAAKAYAIASPAFVLVALAGCTFLVTAGRRTEGVVALAAVLGGVVWSNVLAYHDVNLAPRAQLAELELIGHRFTGDGPALMTEYQPYGVRHFLRALDAEGASELRRRPVPLRDGSVLGKGAYAELASFSPSAVHVYRTLVLRRSPFPNRPDASYGLVWRGRFYDVWQQGAAGIPCDVAAHPVVRRLRGYAPLQRTSFRAQHADTYAIWVGGSFRNTLWASVDGRFAGSRRSQLNNAGQYTQLGTITLSAGPHLIEVRYDSSPVRPGSGGPEYGVGPLVISSASSC